MQDKKFFLKNIIYQYQKIWKFVNKFESISLKNNGTLSFTVNQEKPVENIFKKLAGSNSISYGNRSVKATAWKVSKCFENLWIQSEYRKIRTKKNCIRTLFTQLPFESMPSIREATTTGVLKKKMFLKIPKHSKESICAGASCLIKLQGPSCSFIEKEALAQVFSCEFCEIFESTVFIEHLQTTASSAT